MGINLAMVSQGAIEKAVFDSGLLLSAEQMRDIAEAEYVCLTECGRITFGDSAAVRIIRDFAESSFISGSDAAKTLTELTESFYELRGDVPAIITDVEILEVLKESFDGEATGDVGLAASLAGESLSRRLDYSTYEIADDDGNVYRWDSEEWYDDVMADGWYGERWEGADE